MGRAKLEIGDKCLNGHHIQKEIDLVRSERYTKHQARCRICYRQSAWRKQGIINYPSTLGDHCALCQKVTKDLCADHDPKTKLFRGWLCQYCNRTLIGRIDKLGIEKIIVYLNP